MHESESGTARSPSGTPAPTRLARHDAPDGSPLHGLDAGGLLGAAGTDAHTGDPALAAIQPLFPNYRILERIGRGATSSVYRAEHRKLARTVAIKILDPELGSEPGFLERFQREARATARLQHPFIVTVLDFGDVEGVLYLVLEDCGGATLRKLVSAGVGKRGDALVALARVAEALEYAHGQMAVHRDLKPENVLIDAHGYPRIADFGLARVIEPGTPRLTRTGDVMGTPHYMAPEQVQGREADHRADVYAIGVMAYEILTGDLPVGRFDPPNAAGIGHPALDDLVMRALSADPTARPPLGELRRALEGASRPGAAPSPAPRAAPAAVSTPTLPRRDTQKPARPPAKIEDSKARTVQTIGAGLALIAAFLPWQQMNLSMMGAIEATGLERDLQVFDLFAIPGEVPAIMTLATLIALIANRFQPIRVPTWVVPTMTSIGVLWTAQPLFSGLSPSSSGMGSGLSSIAPGAETAFGRMISVRPEFGAFLAFLAFCVLGYGWWSEFADGRKHAQGKPRHRASSRARAVARRRRLGKARSRGER